MFHTLAYSSSLAAAADFAAVTAIADPAFTSRNSRFIATDDIKLLAAYYLAASATRARFNAPTWNAYGRHQIFPIFRSATVPDDPRLADYRGWDLRVPQNEEIGVEGSNDAGAGDQATCLLWVAPAGANVNLPRGTHRLTARATYAITSVANTWAGPGALTFAENLRGGRYAVVGMAGIDANTLCARLIFPNGNTFSGRQLRPGFLLNNADGRIPAEPFRGGFGQYGVFNTFEPPQIEIFSVNAAAHTGELRMDLVYLGEGRG